jgi:PKD repeat protein
MKKIISFLVLIVLIFNSTIVFSQYSDEYYLQKKEDYKKFIGNHDFKTHPHLTKAELKTIPKKDRPDLANEQNFLQTLDPNLGYVPLNALIIAHKQTDIYTQQNKTSIPGITWSERGPDNVGGRTRALIWDPNDPSGKKVIAGGVAGGIWTNSDITSSSTQWMAVNDFWDNLAVTALAYDPTTTTTMYAGTGEGYYNVDAVRGGGIWKSTDGGTSWNRLNSSTSYTYITRIAVANNGDVYASTNGSGIIRSTNGGTSWSTVLSSSVGGASTSRAADIKIGADGTLFAAMGIFSTDGIYSSADGTTWTKLNTGSNGFPTTGIRRIEIGCAPSDANTIYCLVQGSGNGMNGIYKSTNKGSTWTSLTMPTDADPGVSPDFTRGAQAWYDLSIAVDPNNANTLFIGGIDLFKSSNGGSSWSQVSHWYGGFGFQEVHADQHAAIYYPGSSSKIIFGHDGGISYSGNANAGMPSIPARNKGYNVTQYYAAAINGASGSNNMIAGAQDNGTQKYTNAGINSTTEVTGGDGAFCHIDQSNGNNQISQYVRNVIHRTTNNWASYNTIVNDQGTGLFINPSDYDDKEDIYYSGFANGSSIRLKRITSPFGSATSGTVVIAAGSSDVSHVSCSPYSTSGNSTVFVGTDGGDVFKVSNAQGGSPTVTNIGASLPAGNISCIAIGATEQQLLVTLSNYGVVNVWETTNGGTNWVNKDDGTSLPNMPVRWALYNPLDYNQVFLATEIGVWTTSDLSVGSVDWSPTNNGLANVRTDMLQYRSSDRTIVAATHGRGLFTTIIPISGSAPIAEFSGTPTTLCEGNTVTYTDLSTNTPTSWNWSFPGGTPANSTAQNPTVTYANAGTYNVTLTATNAFGSSAPEVKNTYITVNSCVGHNKLRDSDCGITMLSYLDFIICKPDPGATDIEYEFSNTGLGYLQTISKPYQWRNVYMYLVPGILNNTTYDVRIRSKRNGIWSSYGPTCQITTPVNSTTTHLRDSDCGLVMTDYVDYIMCEAIPGATEIEYEISNTLLGYLQTQTKSYQYRTCYLYLIPGIQNNTTYNVRVRAKINGVYTNYGSICQVTTPTNSVTTELRSGDCGRVLSSYQDHILCNIMPGASFEYEFSNISLGFYQVVARPASARHLYVNQVPGILINTTYDVRVRGSINGVYTDYGATCQVTTPATARFENSFDQAQNTLIDNISNNNLDLIIYPNPSQGEFIYLDLTGIQTNTELFVTDISGKVVHQQQIDTDIDNYNGTVRFNEKLNSGFYFVTIVSGDQKITKKLVVR